MFHPARQTLTHYCFWLIKLLLLANHSSTKMPNHHTLKNLTPTKKQHCQEFAIISNEKSSAKKNYLDNSNNLLQTHSHIMLLKLRIGFLLKFLEIQRGMMFYAARNVCKIKWGTRWWSGGPNVKKKTTYYRPFLCQKFRSSFSWSKILTISTFLLKWPNNYTGMYEMAKVTRSGFPLFRTDKIPWLFQYLFPFFQYFLMFCFLNWKLDPF